jgi:S1-C subfamily serine protease
MSISLWKGKAKWMTLAALLVLVVVVAVTVAQTGKPRGAFNIYLNEPAPYLGVEIEDVTAENMSSHKLTSERGVIVRSVEKASPAEYADLKNNDVIMEYAGTPVFSAAHLTRLVAETPPGRKVDLVISRDGTKMTVTAKIAEGDRHRMFFDRGEVKVVPGSGFEFAAPGGQMFRYSLPQGRFDRFIYPPGRVRTRLGLTLEDLTDQMGDFLAVPGKKGALVTSVFAGSSAAAANLRAGDVIVRAGEEIVANAQDLIRVVERRSSGSKIDLQVIRDKKEITVTVELPG